MYHVIVASSTLEVTLIMASLSGKVTAPGTIAGPIPSRSPSAGRPGGPGGPGGPERQKILMALECKIHHNRDDLINTSQQSPISFLFWGH